MESASPMPFVCGLLALVRLWSMFSTAIGLIFVALGAAAIFGAAVGEHPAKRHLMALEEGITRSSSRSAAVIGVLRS